LSPAGGSVAAAAGAGCAPWPAGGRKTRERMTRSDARCGCFFFEEFGNVGFEGGAFLTEAVAFTQEMLKNGRQRREENFGLFVKFVFVQNEKYLGGGEKCTSRAHKTKRKHEKETCDGFVQHVSRQSWSNLFGSTLRNRKAQKKSPQKNFLPKKKEKKEKNAKLV
jgi:hypothetical protein